jgi:hypothetical protein
VEGEDRLLAPSSSSLIECLAGVGALVLGRDPAGQLIRSVEHRVARVAAVESSE